MRCKYVGKKYKLIVDITIMERRHHAITLILVSEGSGGRGGGRGERKRFTISRLLKWNFGNGKKKSVESGKCLRRKRNESVLNVFPFRVNQLGLIFRRPSCSLSNLAISFPFAF